MVGISEGSSTSIPCLIPSQVSVVEQDPHQLRDCKARVCVVQLYGDLGRKLAPLGIAVAKAPDEVEQGAGDKKVLLHKAECLAHARGVIGIENPGQRFRRQALGERANKLAGAERLKVEEIGRSRCPEPQRVDCLAAIAYDGPIEG